MDILQDIHIGITLTKKIQLSFRRELQENSISFFKKHVQQPNSLPHPFYFWNLKDLEKLNFQLAKNYWVWSKWYFFFTKDYSSVKFEEGAKCTKNQEKYTYIQLFLCVFESHENIASSYYVRKNTFLVVGIIFSLFSSRKFAWLFFPFKRNLQKNGKK